MISNSLKQGILKERQSNYLEPSSGKTLQAHHPTKPIRSAHGKYCAGVFDQEKYFCFSKTLTTTVVSYISSLLKENPEGHPIEPVQR